MKKKFNTRSIHEGQIPDDKFGSVSPPIHQTSTYKQKDIDNFIYDYSRAGNPTRTNLETNLASLEGGSGAVAFSSGMAAITSIIQILSSGDHIIFTSNVYGGTYRLMETVMSRFGVESSWVDTGNIQNVKDAMQSNTKMIFIETPTNPMMTLSDIASLSNLAHENKCLLAVDNTFMSPFCQRPFEYGADLVVHSTTKYLSGHSDVIGGVVIVKDSNIEEKLKFLQMSVGAVPGPFDCWLTQRSLKTLSIRMERHDKNAREIASYLELSNKFNAVFYPGLTSHKDHDLANKQQIDPDGCIRYGGMLSVEFPNYEVARKFIMKLQIFTLAESLGGVESLICHPAKMTHASIPKDRREELGITDGLVRLSIGIEDVDDLIEDLSQAIDFSL